MERAPTDRGERVDAWVERSIERHGVTPRAAAVVIVLVWAAAVVVFAVVQRLADPRTFPTIWQALWWSVQTVTTVGYGDVVPQQTAGKILAGVLMLGGLAFLSVLTAMITSVFVARRQARGLERREDPMVEVIRRLDDITARLDALQAEVREGSGERRT